MECNYRKWSAMGIPMSLMSCVVAARTSFFWEEDSFSYTLSSLAIASAALMMWGVGGISFQGCP
jgi:predicted membrane protein